VCVCEREREREGEERIKEKKVNCCSVFVQSDLDIQNF